MLRSVRNWFQHRFNALHVYCRLKDCGMPEERALRCGRAWEKTPKWAVALLAAALLALASWAVTARADTLIEAGWCPLGEEMRPCLRIVQDGPNGELLELLVPWPGSDGSEETGDAR